MHHHRLHWTHLGVTVLLTLVLAACVRSASTNTALTPLPSAPPPTATSVSEAPTPLANESATATEAPASTATEFPTESLPTETQQTEQKTATATKAVSSATSSCGNALPSRLQINSYAYVNPDPPLPNNLRSEADPNSELLGEIQPGQAMKVLAGPKCVDGWQWWNVRPLNSDLNGWTAEGDEQTYWLIPCASEKECGN